MDFELLENLKNEEIEKLYGDNLFLAVVSGCGCTYEKGLKIDINCYGTIDGDMAIVSCPTLNKYGSGPKSQAKINSDGGLNCGYVCRQVGLVDWFYG